jgi:hypothetical protein
MLPQKAILSIFGVLIAQGNVVHALPYSEPLYTRSERIQGHDIPSDIIARAPTPFADDVAEFPSPHSLDLDRRGDVTTSIAAATLPALCVLGHKILAGIFVYVNCPEPVKNLKETAANLKKAGRQAINFQPEWDLERREAEVAGAVPENVKIPLGKALKDFSNELLKASFIIMDTAAAAVYRAGGDHSDVGGTPLHPASPPASRPATPEPAPAPAPAPRPTSPRPASLPAQPATAPKAPKKANSWKA